MTEQEAAEKERARCVGVLLAEVGQAKLRGRRDLAQLLDRIALELEHPTGQAAR